MTKRPHDIAASARHLGIGASETLLWTNLRDRAASLDPVLVKASFIFLLVGYGTKAGLAPMHNWLPDAHSQAPAPVSALFSGFMLSAAMYCLMRFLPVTDAATGFAGWAHRLLAGFGLLSILVAAAFIPFQKNAKRFLAYSSLEHMGVVAFGLGLGGIGTAAALFHTLNHAFGKTLAFFSAGRLGQAAGGHEMDRLSGSMRRSPLWGMGLFGGILALVGAAPFALFMSELQILKAAVDRGPALPIVLYLAGLAVVFIGAMGHAIRLAWGESKDSVRLERPAAAERVLVLFPLAVLLVLGVWMPGPLHGLIEKAAAVVRDAVIPGIASGGAGR